MKHQNSYQKNKQKIAGQNSQEKVEERQGTGHEVAKKTKTNKQKTQKKC